MNHYETLRELVYKILYPDGIPIYDGEHSVEVLVLGGKLRKITEINYGNGDIKVDRYSHWFSKDEYTVLGKPLSIADVLRALEKKKIYGSPIYENGKLFDGMTTDIVCHINLALPLSAPENSEACEQINNLLK